MVLCHYMRYVGPQIRDIEPSLPIRQRMQYRELVGYGATLAEGDWFLS
jgi:hypothetical protein